MGAILFSRMAPEIVGRFWIPIFDSGQISVANLLFLVQVTIDRQFRALICFIRFAPEFVGRFWIPIFLSGRINIFL